MVQILVLLICDKSAHIMHIVEYAVVTYPCIECCRCGVAGGVAYADDTGRRSPVQVFPRCGIIEIQVERPAERVAAAEIHIDGSVSLGIETRSDHSKVNVQSRLEVKYV